MEVLETGMHPFLGQHPAAAGRRVRLGDDGRLLGALALRVADAVDEAGQVTQVVVNERLHFQLQIQLPRQQPVHPQAGIEQRAAVVRLNPDQQVALGSGHHALQGERRKVEALAEAVPQPRAERHQHRGAFPGHRQRLAQGGAHRFNRMAAPQGEFQEQMLGETAVENTGLMLGHVGLPLQAMERP